MKCGEDVFFRESYPSSEVIYQYKRVTFTIASDAAGGSISEANRLNGVEWKGRLIMSSALYRIYILGHWSEWRQSPRYETRYGYLGADQFKGQAVYEISKKNGVWDASVPEVQLAKPSCSGMPGL